MPELLRRLTLGRAVQLALAATVVVMLLAAGSVLRLLEPARTLRWGLLLALAALVGLAALRARPLGRPRAPELLAGLFVAAAAASALWSAEPLLTLGRAAGFAIVLAVSALVARAVSAEVALGGILLGASALALGGLGLLAFDPDRALQAATTVAPARFQGLGGGPNMAPMVFALAAVPAFLGVLAPRPLAGRALHAGALALLLGSIAFSGSRGAMAAAFAGLLLFALLLRRPVALAAAASLSALTLAVSLLPDEAATNPPTPTGQDPAPAQVTPAPGYLDANVEGPRLQDDIGRPAVGVGDTMRRERTLLGSSGRTEAWLGTLGLAADRPVAGYGFGTEDRTFVDRYVFFNSNVPENSYLGILLQLGLAGLALLGALATALLAPLRRRRVPPVAAAAGGAFGAALVLGLFQSYLYAPGNAATIVAWTSGFVAYAAATRSES